MGYQVNAAAHITLSYIKYVYPSLILLILFNLFTFNTDMIFIFKLWIIIFESYTFANQGIWLFTTDHSITGVFLQLLVNIFNPFFFTLFFFTHLFILSLALSSIVAVCCLCVTIHLFFSHHTNTIVVLVPYHQLLYAHTFI